MRHAIRSRIVIDTNLIVSGLIAPGGTAGRLLDALDRGNLRVLITDEILDEIGDVLRRPAIRRRHKLPDYGLEAFLERLDGGAERVEPLHSLPLRSRDREDDKFLAAALGGRAEYLVTGDRDLLVLAGDTALGDLRIVTAREFFDLSGI